MTYVCLDFFSCAGRMQIRFFRILLLHDESADFQQIGRYRLVYPDTGHMCLVGAGHDFFQCAFGLFPALVVHQVHSGSCSHLVFNRKKQCIAFKVKTKYGQPGTLANAGHAAYAFIIIHHRDGRCGIFPDGAVFTGESTGIAGKAVKAVKQHKRFCPHTFP